MPAAARWLAALVLTGCTSTVPHAPPADRDHAASTARTPSTPAGLAIVGGYEGKAAIYATARTIDPCALHHVPAAEEVTGVRAHALMPDGSNLASCELDLAPETEKLSVWHLSTSVAAPLDAGTRRDATAEQIEGVEFLRGENPADGRSCRYITAVAPQARPGLDDKPTSTVTDQADEPGGTRLELRVRRDSPNAQPKSACQVARQYLAKVAGYWRLPALRRDGLTTPAFRLAEVDPCAGLAGAGPAMGGPLDATPQGVYHCVVRRAAGPGNTEPSKVGAISATLAVKRDPRAALNNPTTARGLRPHTVAGKPAVITQKTGDPDSPKPDGGCTLTVVIDESVTIDKDVADDIANSVQVAEVQASTCDLATVAAESLIASIR